MLVMMLLYLLCNVSINVILIKIFVIKIVIIIKVCQSLFFHSFNL